jgi:hypothetical protein
MLLFFFLVIAAFLAWGGVGFAIENPAGTTINYTLTGGPDCINRGAIKTDEEKEHGMYVEGKDDEGESHYASNFGKVITRGYRAYGMYANLGAIATNESEGTITTHGDNAHGMYAKNASTIMNNSLIETKGYHAYGMYAKGYYDDEIDDYYHSTATNNGRIATRGDKSYGMYAKNGAIATNESEGTITTHGDQAYGMYAKGYESSITNKGFIETRGDDTHIGDKAYGMYAKNGAIATNESEGTITTHGEEAHGMYAKGYYYDGDYDDDIDVNYRSTVTNNGRIVTRGNYASGMEAWDIATAINNGSIVTRGDYASGMLAGYDSTATNESGGTITTHGEEAHGMYAYDNSTVTNNGRIATRGYKAYGMYVKNESTATNESDGTITTHGDQAYGMYAKGYESSITNKGFIETRGDEEYAGYEAYGMYAKNGAIATNESDGTITTHGDQAHGMYAKGYYDSDNYSNAINNGRIITRGYYASGMLAEDGTTATNNGQIITRGDSAFGMTNFSYGVMVASPEDNSGSATAVITNNGSISTYGNWAFGMYIRGGYSPIPLNTNSDDNNEFVTEAVNNGDITTRGEVACGMLALYDSTAINNGSIETNGLGSFGMLALDGSTATNESDGTITTHGEGALGMLALENAMAINKGSIVTNGDPIIFDDDISIGAYGMVAAYNSTAVNESVGTIATYGKEAYGMYARIALPYVDTPVPLSDEGNIDSIDVAVQNHNNSFAAKAINRGTITTYGKEAHGMYISGDYEFYPLALRSFDDDISDDTSAAINTGTITVTGEGADAVYVDNSTFTNSGTLDSLRGNAITSANSTVNLEDGTKLPNSHNIVGDDGSTLNVNMAGDLAAIVNFGTFNKNGTGTLTLEEGSSAGTTNNNAGTLKIAPDTTFETNSYTQTAEARLHLYVPSNSDVGLPLKINNEGGTAAQFAGKVVIDYSSQPLPGMYKYIYVAGERSNDFDSVSFVNPGGIYKTFMPQWVPGNSFYYTSIVGYAFSEQALGLVSAIEDWSLLRWIMANHLQDVVSEMDNLEAGKKVYYAHFLSSKTDRDPSGGSPLGYESDTRGLSFGFDKKTDDRTVWGIYAGYTEKDIDFTDVVPASSDWEEQDSWYIGAYMSKRFDKWIISDTLTYRSTDHDSFRRQKDGDARASFDSWAVTNDIRAGYVVKEIGKDSHWEIVPEVGLNVGYFNRDGYKETNGYTYGDYDTTVTEGVIGVRFKGEFISKDGSRFSPYLRLSYVNVLSGDDVTIDEIRYGNKSWFTEKLDDDYFAADLGMTLYSAGNFDMSLSYNGRFGDDTDSHGGWLRLEWKQ